MSKDRFLGPAGYTFTNTTQDAPGHLHCKGTLLIHGQLIHQDFHVLFCKAIFSPVMLNWYCCTMLYIPGEGLALLLLDFMQFLSDHFSSLAMSPLCVYPTCQCIINHTTQEGTFSPSTQLLVKIFKILPGNWPLRNATSNLLLAGLCTSLHNPLSLGIQLIPIHLVVYPSKPYHTWLATRILWETELKILLEPR